MLLFLFVVVFVVLFFLFFVFFFFEFVLLFVDCGFVAHVKCLGRIRRSHLPSKCRNNEEAKSQKQHPHSWGHCL
jgi:hypothetical protein